MIAHADQQLRVIIRPSAENTVVSSSDAVGVVGQGPDLGSGSLIVAPGSSR